MATVTTSTIALPLNAFYVKKLLEAAQPNDIHGLYLDMQPLPEGQGTQTVKFRRYDNIATTTTALTEGVTPVSSTAAVTDLTCVTSQYGTWIPYTDQFKFLQIEDGVTKIQGKLGQQAGHSVDETRRDVLVAGTVLIRANGSARTDITGALTASMLKQAIRTLKRTNTEFIAKKITASDGVGTSPIRPGFISYVHPDTTVTLENIAGYVPVSEYPQGDGMQHEVGAYKEIRFLESMNAKVFTDGGGSVGATGMISTTGTSTDVYATVIFGAEFASGTALAGHAMETIIKPLGWKDELNQLGSIGWKGQWVTLITNDTHGVRLESCNLTTPA